MAESSSRGFDGGPELIGRVQDVNEFRNTNEPSNTGSSNSGSHLAANREKSEELHAQPHRVLTARELHSCIIASESTRAVCSILIALLVVLSHIDYPLLGVKIVSHKSILAAKPLYMVLLSDITVVAAHFVLSKGRGRVGITEEVEKKVSREGLNWARAVMVLERGLVLYQTIRAIFIDCSVYMVIVACGLSPV